MKEYKISKGWAIFVYITAPLLIALFVAILIIPFTEKSRNVWQLFWIMGPISIAMIVATIAGILDTINGKFIIGDDKVFLVKTFSKRELLFSEIKGYRVNDKYIIIESNTRDKKRIKISLYFGRTNEIIDWLSSHYRPL